MSSEVKQINMRLTDKYTNIISHIVGVYVFLMLCIFPLYVTDMYFHILDDKFIFFWVGTAITAALCALIGLLFVTEDKRKNKSAELKALISSAKAKPMRERIRPADCFFGLFLVVSIISTIGSTWLYEAFWGNMGRYQGLFFWIWAAVCYVLITRFFRFDRRYIDVFLVAGVLLAIFAVTDFYQMDILGWQGAISDWKERANYSTTIGNVNCVTAVVGIYLGVSSLMFIQEKSKLRSLFYFAVTVIMFMAISAAQSDNALLGIGVLICFLPFFAWSTRRGFVRYILICFAMVAGFALIGFFAALHTGAFIPDWAYGVLLKLSTTLYKPLFIVAVALAVLCLALCTLMYFLSSKTGCSYDEYMDGRLPNFLRITWGMLGVIAAGLLVWMFYDANHGGHPEFFEPLANIFIWNDEWGTHRGYNWSLLLGYMEDFNIFNKMFGAGHETYGIYTEIHDHYAMVNRFGEIYDSPHNEILQYLFSVGIIGFIGYYGGLISSVVKMFTSKISRFAPVCAFALLMYTAQSSINISTPVVTPIVIMILGLGINAAYNGDKI